MVDIPNGGCNKSHGKDNDPNLSKELAYCLRDGSDREPTVVLVLNKYLKSNLNLGLRFQEFMIT